MKNNKLNIIAILLIIAGLIVFLCGFANVGFDITKLDTNGEPIEKKYTASNGNLNINTELKNIKVILEPSRDSDIHVTYYENNTTYYDIYENNNELYIKKIDKPYNMVRIFSFEITNLSCKIYIPNGYDGEIFINTTNDKVEINNIDIDGDINLKTTNDKIVLYNIKGNTIDLKTTNGKIELNKVEGNMIKLNTTNNKIILDNVKGDTVKLQTTNGEIELNKVDVDSELSCLTTNDSITGTVIGNIDDFSITSKTTNDKNNLPAKSTSGDKYLSAITTNDKIKIDFIH